MMGARFAAVAGPLAILGQALSSATAGLQTLTRASQLVASSFAPIFLPAALMLATSFTAVAELMEKFGPQMEDFFGVMLDILLPAVTASIDGFILLADVVKGVSGTLKEFGAALALASGEIHGRGTREARERVGGATRDVLESFRRSLGPKATISGLGEVGKSVQLAALNADPLEARLMRQQLMVLERIAAAVERREAGPTPRVHDPATTTAMRTLEIGSPTTMLLRAILGRGA